MTGRSRLTLFAARVPAGLALLLPFAASGFAVTAGGSLAFNGDLSQPSGTLLWQSAAWFALTASIALAISLGIASLVSSRGTSIGVLLAWQLAAMPVLMQIKALGWFRELLFYAAATRIEPGALIGDGPDVPMSLAAAMAVLFAWTVIPLALGAWRTLTRDA